MKTLHRNQSGSHLVAIALVILVAGVIGFAGYTVMNHNKTAEDATPVAATSTTAPSTIKNSSDLSQTAKALDGADSSVDSDLNTSGLDTSLNDLL